MISEISLDSNYGLLFQADGLLVVADYSHGLKEFVRTFSLPWDAEYITLPQAPIVPTMLSTTISIDKLRKNLKMRRSVNDLVDAVTEADLREFALYLSGEGSGSTLLTRQSQSADAVRSGQWALSVFASYGFNVTTDSFSGSYCPNIIAEKRGTRTPNNVVILGAHLDDRNTVLNDANGRAPGANDDGR
jgi:hypothetical protein